MKHGALDQDVELDLMRAKSGEVHDLSPGAFRFIFVLIVAAAALMVAGAL
jgi:hypothetical protein